MSKLVLWSDLHLGHDSAIRWRTQFKTPEEHHETIFEALCQMVNKRDTMVLLGDIALTMDWLERVASIPCTKSVVVLGNHDTEKRDGITSKDHVRLFTEVHSMWKLRRIPCWLTHAPIHPQELRGKFNIHGHCHSHVITKEGSDEKDPRYINICPEQTDWKPVVFQQLLKERDIK